jgi:putative ribosome biogenesis GTPase RsgA
VVQVAQEQVAQVTLQAVQAVVAVVMVAHQVVADQGHKETDMGLQTEAETQGLQAVAQLLLVITMAVRVIHQALMVLQTFMVQAVVVVLKIQLQEQAEQMQVTERLTVKALAVQVSQTEAVVAVVAVRNVETVAQVAQVL